MAVKSWTVIDSQRGIYLDDFSAGPEHVGGSARGYAVNKRTYRGGLSDGVDCIHVDNGKLSFDLLPTRGMGLWRAWLGDELIGWQSPVRGPVHPKFVPLGEPTGLGWLDGFDELLVRCGLQSNGAPDFEPNGQLKYPLHGRIANRPASRVDVEVDGEAGRISVTGQVDETRFLLCNLRLTTTVSTQVGQAGLTIRDEVQNLSGQSQEIQLLYHFNVGAPLLDAGARLVAPAKTVVPRDARAAEGIGSWDSYTAPQPGFAEQVYFMDLLARPDGTTQVLLKNAHSTRGVSLAFNNFRLPCFTLWKNTAALADGYVTGLEPATNFPNRRTFEGEQNRVVQLRPGGKVDFELEIQIHSNPAEVEAAERAIAEIQQQTRPNVYQQPQKGWCDGA